MSLDVVEDDWILLRIMKRIGGAVGVMEARERGRANGREVFMYCGGWGLTYMYICGGAWKKRRGRRRLVLLYC